MILSSAGKVIFAALPFNNMFSLIPSVCANATFGNVTILSVNLDPWELRHSDIQATGLNPKTGENYIAIGEQLTLTVKVCMPESQTGIHLYATLPHEGETVFVVLNDAYVEFIGSNLLNATLVQGSGEYKIFKDSVVFNDFLQV